MLQIEIWCSFLHFPLQTSWWEHAPLFLRNPALIHEPQKTVFQNIRESVEPNLIKVFTYKPDPTDIASVCSIIEAIPKMGIPKSEEFSREILPPR